MGRADSPLRGRLIFLVGARRSGTNWLHRILTAHPDVTGIPPETYLFSHGLEPLAQRIHHGPPGSNRTGFVWMDREVFLDAARDFCDAVFGGLLEVLGHGRPSDRLLERTPWHVFSLDLIGSVYPDAHVVHLLRDGRDVARSLVAQDWGPDTLAEAAEEWRSSVEAGRRAAASLTGYVEVRYEDLLADPAARIGELLRALELDAGEATVNAALTEAGVRFNVDPGSRRVGVGKWREHFSPDDLRTVEAVAGPTLVQLGYELATDAAPRPSGPPHGGRSILGAFGRRKAGAGRRALATVEREVLARLDVSQQVVDALFDAVARRSPDEVAALMTPEARVHIEASGQAWEGRGPEALGRFLETLETDPAFSGRQVRGNLHTAVPTTTAVITYRLEGGELTQRTIAVTVTGGKISEVWVYGVEGAV